MEVEGEKNNEEQPQDIPNEQAPLPAQVPA